MSPWGKFYLSNVEFRPNAWEPFSSWRMHYLMGDIVERWGWRVSKYLDCLTKELQRPITNWGNREEVLNYLYK